MKKVKVMLTAIAVFAVVGGALAFKASKGVFVYCADLAHPGALAGTPECPRTESTFTFTEVNTQSYCTTTIKNETLGETGLCEIPAIVEFKQ